MAVPVIETFAVTATTSSVVTLAATIPSGTTDGDLLYMDANGFTDNPLLPSGWTNIAVFVDGNGEHGTRLCWKIASGEGATVDVSTGGSVEKTVTILRISGHDPSDPINIFGTNTGLDDGDPVLSPSVTTTVDDCLVVRGAGIRQVTTINVPAGHTAIDLISSGSNADDIQHRCAYKTQASAGSTGTGEFDPTPEAGRAWAASTVAITPAPLPPETRFDYTKTFPKTQMLGIPRAPAT